MKSHCDYECNCSSGARGPCSSDGARRCFMPGNREEESEKGKERGRVGGKYSLPGHSQCFLLADSPLLFLLFALLFLLLPQHPSLLSYSLLYCPPPFGRISRVSLEGKCNNAPTRWNRARSIISREMDGPCRAGGGHERTQFRFNKLAKQDPQSDLSLTRRRCLLLRC